MSTNHTPNFHLSQWERSDKVLMDDFNADNAKIDAALFCHPSAERICSVEVEEETSTLSLDISQVDWNRYMALAMLVESSAFGGYYATMYSLDEIHTFVSNRAPTVGGGSELLCCYASSNMFALLPVFYDGNHTPLVFSFGYGRDDAVHIASLGAGGSKTPLNQCKQLTLRRVTGTFVPGDRAALWGVK